MEPVLVASSAPISFDAMNQTQFHSTSEQRTRAVTTNSQTHAQAHQQSGTVDALSSSSPSPPAPAPPPISSSSSNSSTTVPISSPFVHATTNSSNALSGANAPTSSTPQAQSSMMQQQRAFKPSSRAQPSLGLNLNQTPSAAGAAGGSNSTNAAVSSSTPIHSPANVPYQSLLLNQPGGVHRPGAQRLNSPLPHRVTGSPLRIHSPVPRPLPPATLQPTASVSPLMAPQDARDLSPARNGSGTPTMVPSGFESASFTPDGSLPVNSNTNLNLLQVQSPSASQPLTPLSNANSTGNSPLPLPNSNLGVPQPQSLGSMAGYQITTSASLVTSPAMPTTSLWQRQMNGTNGMTGTNAGAGVPLNVPMQGFPPPTAGMTQSPSDPNLQQLYYANGGSSSGPQSPALPSMSHMTQAPYSPSGLPTPVTPMPPNVNYTLYGTPPMQTRTLPQMQQQANANTQASYNMQQASQMQQTSQMQQLQPGYGIVPPSYNSPLAYYNSSNSPGRVLSPMPMQYVSGPQGSPPLLSQPQGHLSPLTIPLSLHGPTYSNQGMIQTGQGQYIHAPGGPPMSSLQSLHLLQQQQHLSGKHSPLGLPGQFQPQRRASVPHSFHSMNGVHASHIHPTNVNHLAPVDSHLNSPMAGHISGLHSPGSNVTPLTPLTPLQQHHQIQAQQSYRSAALQAQQHQVQQQIHQLQQQQQQLYALEAQAALGYVSTPTTQPLARTISSSSNPPHMPPHSQPLTSMPQVSPSSSIPPAQSRSRPSIDPTIGTGRGAGGNAWHDSASTAKDANKQKGRDFICTVCSEVMHSRFSLKRHLKKHTGEKPHKCTFAGCTKSFFEASTLKRHVRIHTGCRFAHCNKAFADATNVKRHEMTHTGAKPFTCLVAECSRSFSRSSSLKQHMHSLHKIDVTNLSIHAAPIALNGGGNAAPTRKRKKPRKSRIDSSSAEESDENEDDEDDDGDDHDSHGESDIEEDEGEEDEGDEVAAAVAASTALSNGAGHGTKRTRGGAAKVADEPAEKKVKQEEQTEQSGMLAVSD